MTEDGRVGGADQAGHEPSRAASRPSGDHPSRENVALAAHLIAQVDDVVRDMSSHVGDQIFDVLKRNGLLMRSEAAATVMMIEASVQMLAQAADQCSRAAEVDCSDAVVAVFIQILRERLASGIDARSGETERLDPKGESPSDAQKPSGGQS